MGQADYYKHGDWNAICDRCGFKYKASDLKLEYTGLRVCKWCWDPRHPQERLRVRPDDPSVPWTRTEPDDVEIEQLGPELVPDPFFNTNATWVTGARGSDSDWDVSGVGVYVNASGTLNVLTGNLGLVAGNTYTVAIDIDTVSSGLVSVTLDRSTAIDDTGTAGEHSGDITVDSDGAVEMTFRSAPIDMRVKSLSVRRKFV